MFSAGAGYVRNLLRRIPTFKSLTDLDRDKTKLWVDRVSLTMLLTGGAVFIYPKYMEKRTMSLYNEERRIQLLKWMLQQNEKECPNTEEDRRAKLERELLLKALLEGK